MSVQCIGMGDVVQCVCVCACVCVCDTKTKIGIVKRLERECCANEI